MSSDEYAVLVLVAEDESIFAARRAYGDALRAHEKAVREYGPAVEAYESTALYKSNAARKAAFMAACRIVQGMDSDRIILPSGGSLEVPKRTGPAKLEARFRQTQNARHPPPPRPPGPPPARPKEPQSLAATGAGHRRCWTATLTAPATATKELGGADSERIEPPPAFVTKVLNTVAADGWSVHHVAEDRAMAGDEIRLVAVRYLLRRAG